MEKIWDTIVDHPYMTAGGVLVLVLLFSRSGSSAPAGQDYSASLASLAMTTDANVKLAEISAGRDVAAAGIQKDLAVAAMGLEAQNKMSTMAGMIASFESQKAATEVSAFNALQTFQSALGYQAQSKALDNEKLALERNFNLGVRSIDLQQFGLATQADVEKASIAEAGITNRYSMDKMLEQARLDIDALNISLPFEERMFNRQKASEENYYWRQKQIAKQQGMFGLFDSLITGGFGLASQAMPSR
jgi:hypothetical protein